MAVYMLLKSPGIGFVGMQTGEFINIFLLVFVAIPSLPDAKFCEHFLGGIN
jgi:hypothetical protein